MISVSLSLPDGRPLQVLSDLIRERTRVLGETEYDAVIATAITVLKSLRASTRKSRSTAVVTERLSDKLSISVNHMIGLRVGFSGRSHKLCIRDESGARLPQIRPWIRVSPSELPSAKVYRIALSGDRVSAWPYQRRISYMIAANQSSAVRVARERFSKVVAKSSGLARDALSRAMQLASSRPASFGSKRAHIVMRESVVSVAKTGEWNAPADSFGSFSFALEVNDDLNYAISALPGGAAAVSDAMARAANSVAGMLRNRLSRATPSWFSPSYPSSLLNPFPPEYFESS